MKNVHKHGKALGDAKVFSKSSKEKEAEEKNIIVKGYLQRGPRNTRKPMNKFNGVKDERFGSFNF